MHELVTHDVNLPGAVLCEDRTTSKKAVVTEIQGIHQAQVAAKLKQDPTAALVTLLQQCVIELGGKKPTVTSLHKLLTGDVDALLLGIYEASFPGEPLSIGIKCLGCDQHVNDRIPMENVTYVEIEDGTNEYWEYDNEDNSWSPGKLFIVDDEFRFKVKNDKLGIKACFKYPTLADSLASSKIAQINPVEARHRLYANCLKEWDGKEITHSFNSANISTLPTRALEFIDDAFSCIPPGPDNPVITVCKLCGYENESSLVAADFLSRLLARRRLSKGLSSKRRK